MAEHALLFKPMKPLSLKPIGMKFAQGMHFGGHHLGNLSHLSHLGSHPNVVVKNITGGTGGNGNVCGTAELQFHPTKNTTLGFGAKGCITGMGSPSHMHVTGPGGFGNPSPVVELSWGF